MEFRYSARNASGDIVRGVLEATDAVTAGANLQRRALFVTALAPRRTRKIAGVAFGRGHGYASCRRAFFRSLATLIGAGVPLRRGLDVAIERCADRAFAAALRDVLACVERGDALSAAFRQRADIFPEVIIAMTAAGEAGGILDEVLERVADLVEREDALRKSVTGALAYPAIVFAATCLLAGFMVVRVIPTFAGLFASLHVELPAPTRVLLAIGTAATSPAIAFALAAAAAAPVLAAAAAARTATGRLALDRLRFALPIVGTLLRKATLARFARMLGTLVRAGVELSAAIELIAPVSGSPLYAGALRRVAVALREGEALCPPLAASGLFEGMFVALVGMGEEAGMLDAVLPKAAEYFEADVAATVSTLGAVIEPALILFLGGAIGAVVYAIYVPLYSLIGSISQ